MRGTGGAVEGYLRPLEGQLRGTSGTLKAS